MNSVLFSASEEGSTVIKNQLSGSVCSNISFLGLAGGCIVTILGANIGSFVSFILCRALAKDIVVRTLSTYENLKQVVGGLLSALFSLQCCVNMILHDSPRFIKKNRSAGPRY